MTTKRRIELRVDGMTCDHCVVSVDKALRDQPGVEYTKVHLESGNAVILGSERMSPQDLIVAVRKAGYSPRLVSQGEAPEETGGVSDDFRGTGETEHEPRGAGDPAGESREASGASSDFDADLTVIGGGSAGFAAAIRAQELGARVLMINDGTIGGTCVNVGCVPSKTLIRAAEAHHRSAHHPFAGIQGTSRVTDFGAIIRQKDALVDSLRQEKYADVLAAYDRIQWIDGHASFRSSKRIRVDGREVRSHRFVVATGSTPWLPPVPGLREADPLTSTTAFALDRLPESLIVMGGRYIALECAQLFHRLGTKVTLLQRSDHILPTEDDDLTDKLAGYLRDEGIHIETGVQFERVERDGHGVTIRARLGGEARTFTAERVLSATGRRPITAGMGLVEIGVGLGEDGRVQVDDTLQSSVPGIYAAGDVIGEPAFVYTAAYEGALAAANALAAEPTRRDYGVLPWVIFTDPQVAGVGLNETEAAQRGLAVDVVRLDLKHVPRALAARDTRGFIKLVKEQGGDRLLGARILAPEGGEQIMEAALAIRHGIGVSELASMFHPYLTQAEGVKLGAQAFHKDIRKLSCCSA